MNSSRNKRNKGWDLLEEKEANQNKAVYMTWYTQ